MNNNYSTFALSSNLQNLSQYFIVFIINNKKYALSIHNVAEVINIPRVEIPETTPEGIIGMFNYNGTVIKMVDLCPLLGFETSNFSLNNRIIISCYKNEYFAIHTEDIENITIFEEKNIQNLPYSNEKSILKQIYKSENGSINIIDNSLLYELISSNKKLSKINYSKLFPDDEKANQILDLRALNHIKPSEAFSFPDSSQTPKQFILFIMDNQNYFMDIKYIKEFISLKHLNITKLPYTEDYITGIVSVKGEFLVVFDLKKFINIGNDNQDKLNKNANLVKTGKLIVIEGKNFNIAFLVDDIKYIQNLKSINKSKMYSSSHQYVYAEFMEDNELYSILNFDEIINDERLYINIE